MYENWDLVEILDYRIIFDSNYCFFSQIRKEKFSDLLIELNISEVEYTEYWKEVRRKYIYNRISFEYYWWFPAVRWKDNTEIQSNFIDYLISKSKFIWVWKYNIQYK